MPSFKLNVADVTDRRPDFQALEAVLRAYGSPTGSPVGVLNVGPLLNGVTATVRLEASKTLQQFNHETKLMTDVSVRSTKMYPFAIQSVDGRVFLETFAGSTKSIKKVRDFLNDDAQVSLDATPVDLDLVELIQYMDNTLEGCAVKSVTVKPYPFEDQAEGTFTPKFRNPADGVAFIQDQRENVKSVRVVCGAGDLKVCMTIKPDGGFAFSCKEDRRAEVVQNILGFLTRSNQEAHV